MGMESANKATVGQGNKNAFKKPRLTWVKGRPYLGSHGLVIRFVERDRNRLVSHITLPLKIIGIDLDGMDSRGGFGRRHNGGVGGTAESAIGGVRGRSVVAVDEGRDDERVSSRVHV